MEQAPRAEPYDLAERTVAFAQGVIALVRCLPRNVSNVEVARQLVRSAGSVGANYVEADGALGKKDLLMKLRTCRREAKESLYWLRLLDLVDPGAEVGRTRLVKEAGELVSIFGAIITKVDRRTTRS